MQEGVRRLNTCESWGVGALEIGNSRARIGVRIGFIPLLSTLRSLGVFCSTALHHFMI